MAGSQKAGMFITVSIMFYSPGAGEWNIYDKYRCFQVSERMQVRFVCISLLVGLADGVFAHYETDSLILFGSEVVPAYINILHSRYFSNENFVGCSLNWLLVVLILAGYIVRYKPLLNMIYAALCISHHLTYLNQRLFPLSRRNKRRLSSGAVSMVAAELASDAEHPFDPDSIRLNTIGGGGGGGGEIEDERNNSELYLRKSSRRQNQNLWPAKDSVTMESSLDSRLDLMSSSARTGQQQHGGSTTIASMQPHYVSMILPEDFGRIKREPALKKHRHRRPSGSGNCVSQRFTEINDLHQLEAHITRLSLFVGEVDRCNGTVVFFICILNLIQFIYCGFFLLDANITDPVRMVVSIFFTLSRLAVPVYSFKCGSTLEHQAKLMIAQLETIYLQDSAKSSIYERYGGSAEAMSSLARTIRRLESIQFTCDGLMSIDFGTLKKFLVQTVTAMFIVIQYG